MERLLNSERAIDRAKDMYACTSDRRESDRETARALILLACFSQRDACAINSKACYVISIYWHSQEFKVFCGTRMGSM